MRRLKLTCAAGLVLSLAFCAGAMLIASAEEQLQVEKTIEFRPSKTFPLETKVGKVEIESVEVRDAGRGHATGLASRFRGGGEGSEMSTIIKAHFLAENKTSENWEVTFTLEFLDKAGKIIDRVSRKAKWDDETHPFDIDHPMLEYVVPMIAKVRIKMEGAEQ